MSSKTVKEVAESTDLGKLYSIVGGVIGETCWKVAFGYGGELRLHLGKPVSYENPKMAGERKGEWRFASCGTGWTLFTPNGVVSSKKGSEQTLEKRAKAIEGSKLIDFSVSVLSGL